jgi:hypothetical protein
MSYYISRKSKLLKDFDRTASLLRDHLIQRYGEEFTEFLSADHRSRSRCVQGNEKTR